MVQSQAQAPAITQTQTLYTHSAEPKAVQQRRAKYRDEDEALAYPANIMFDKRVVRGNTYAARILPADMSVTDKLKSTNTTQRRTSRTAPPRTPGAVDGRRHIDIQTDAYLEELTDTVPESECQTQTDAFLDRPPTPLFVPQKTGVDVVTQIEQGDLFDFDFEVEPILEVLVGKVLEQGLMEVLEEEELAAMRAHQEHFEQIRNAELVASQRMEAAEKRKNDEKERRLTQERERLERERVVRQKVAASTFARGYLGGIVTSVFDQLQSSGFFFDPVLKEVEDSFMPWLKQQAVKYLEQGVIARQVVRRVVADATAALEHTRSEAAARVDQEAIAAEAWARRQEQLKAEAAEKQEADIRAKAAFILADLQPVIASQETIDGVREELVTAAQTEADATYEAGKATAAEEARTLAEAAAAEQAAKLDELKAAAAEAAEEAAAAAEEAGDEAGPPAEELTLDEPMVDVEAEVAKAVEAVPRPEPKPVTDGDVLSAMLDKGVVAKDAIVQSLAIHMLAEDSYMRNPLFQPAPSS